jgi:hypothetical protein
MSNNKNNGIPERIRTGFGDTEELDLNLDVGVVLDRYALQRIRRKIRHEVAEMMYDDEEEEDGWDDDEEQEQEQEEEEPFTESVCECEFCKDMNNTHRTFEEWQPDDVIQQSLKKAIDQLETRLIHETDDDEFFKPPPPPQ